MRRHISAADEECLIMKRQQLVLAALATLCAGGGAVAQETYTEYGRQIPAEMSPRSVPQPESEPANSPDTATAEAPGQSPVRSKANDLESSIVHALVMNPTTEGADVTVQAELDGSVTLAGRVHSQAERELAERVAKEVAGVTSVRNVLEVHPQPARGDREVEAEIEALLREDAALDDGAVAVRVRDGVVELAGAVQSPAEKDRAVEAAWATGAMIVDARALNVGRAQREQR
jgi:hyperosmotically inducible protein